MARRKRKSRRRERALPHNLLRQIREVHELLEQEEKEEAFYIARRLAKQYPQYPDVWVALYLSAVDRIHYQTWALWHLCDLTPHEPLPWSSLAAAATALDYVVLAHQAAQKYLSLAPRGQFVQDIRELEQGLSEEVENIVEELHTDFPHLTRERALELWLLHEKAQLAASVGELQTSIQYNEKVLAIEPGFIPAQNNLGLAYFRAGKYDEALRILRQAYETASSGFALAYLARYTRMLGRLEEAENYMGKLRAYVPELADEAFAKLETFALFGSDQDVLNAFEEVQQHEEELDPIFLSRAYHYAAAAHMRLGDERKARRLWKKALDIHEGNIHARENLRSLDAPPYQRHAPWYISASLLLPGPEPVEIQVLSLLREGLDSLETLTDTLAPLLEQYPYLPHVLSTMFERGGPYARTLAATIATALDTPQAIQSLVAAATGRWGPDSFRLFLLGFLWRLGKLPNRSLSVYILGQQYSFEAPDIEFDVVEETPEDPDIELLHEHATEALPEAPWRSELLYRKALELAPQDDLITANLAVALLYQKRIDDAKELLEQAMARLPRPFICRSLRARIALLEEDPAAAEAFLEPLEHEHVWHVTAWEHYCETRIWLAMHHEDADGVRQWLVWWYLVGYEIFPAAEPYWKALAEGKLHKALKKLMALPWAKERKPPRYHETLDIHIGDHVRVRKGVRDPDFPGHRLDGYTGWVINIEDWEDGYGVLIAWDTRTLKRIPKRVWQKAERQGLHVDRIWLHMEEVERA